MNRHPALRELALRTGLRKSAYASRRCAVHADAPLSQLSARGTMWSMSRPEADVTHVWSWSGW